MIVKTILPIVYLFALTDENPIRQHGILASTPNKEKTSRSSVELKKFAYLLLQEELKQAKEQLIKEEKIIESLKSKLNDDKNNKLAEKKMKLQSKLKNKVHKLEQLKDTKSKHKKKNFQKEEKKLQKNKLRSIQKVRESIGDLKIKINTISELKEKQLNETQAQLDNHLQNRLDIQSKIKTINNAFAKQAEDVTKIPKNKEKNPKGQIKENKKNTHKEAMLKLVDIKEYLEELKKSLKKTLKEGDLEKISEAISHILTEMLRMKIQNHQYINLIDNLKQQIIQENDTIGNKSELINNLDQNVKKLNGIMLIKTDTTLSKEKANKARWLTAWNQIEKMIEERKKVEEDIDKQGSQLIEIKKDVGIQINQFKENLHNLTKHLEEQVNNVLITKASETDMKRLDKTVRILQAEKNTIKSKWELELQTQGKIYKKLHKHIQKVEEDLNNKASVLELNSMKDFIDVIKNQTINLERNIKLLINNMVNTAKNYEKNIDLRLQEKAKKIEQNANITFGLSKSVETLENSINDMKENLNNLKNYQNKTNTFFINKVQSHMNRLTKLEAIQTKFMNIFQTFPKKSEIQAIEENLNSTEAEVNKIRKEMFLSLNSNKEKIDKQRRLLQALAEESSSGFSSLLRQLKYSNNSLEKLYKYLENIGKKLEKSAIQIEENTKIIETVANFALQNKNKTEENKKQLEENKKWKIITFNNLQKAKEELQNVQNSVAYQKNHNALQDQEMHEIENDINNLQKSLLINSEKIDFNAKKTNELKEIQDLQAVKLNQTNESLNSIKENTLTNSELISKEGKEIQKNNKSIQENKINLDKNTKKIANEEKELLTHDIKLKEHDNEFDNAEKEISLQGQDISHFMEEKTQEKTNNLAFENSDEADNYLVEFGGISNGMLVSPPTNINFDDIQIRGETNLSVCLKMSIQSREGSRNIFSLAKKSGLHYNIVFQIVFVMFGKGIYQIQIKYHETIQVIRLSNGNQKAINLFCFNQDRFFVNSREFILSSKLPLNTIFENGIVFILGFNDMRSSLNEIISIAGFDAASHGFEGTIYDVSVWSEEMNVWENHRENLLKNFGCSWENPDGEKLVTFEKQILAGGKVYGTTDIHLDDDCRYISPKENELENNHGLSISNIEEVNNIEQEDREISLPPADLNDHGVGFNEEKHILVDNRKVPTTNHTQSIEPNVVHVIENEEDVDVHLPDDNIQDHGLSFKNEKHNLKSEPDVDASLPATDLDHDIGQAFTEEKHEDIEQEETAEVTLPETETVDEGIGFRQEPRNYTIETEPDDDVTLPAFTVDKGHGFFDENHDNLSDEEEMTDATLPPSTFNDTGVAYTSEEHHVDIEEEANVTLPVVDLDAEEGIPFLRENHTGSVFNETELENVTLPFTDLGNEDFNSFSQEKHNITNEEELDNVTISDSEKNEKTMGFLDEDHKDFKATDVEKENVTLPPVDLNNDIGVAFLDEKRNFTIPSEEELNVTLPETNATDIETTFTNEKHNITYEEEVDATLPPSIPVDEGKGFSAEDHADVKNDEELEDVNLGETKLVDNEKGFLEEDRGYPIPDEEDIQVELKPEAPAVTRKSFIEEDHPDLQHEEEVDVNLGPSNFDQDGIGFKDESPLLNVESEEEVEAHLPEGPVENPGVGYIQAHVATDTKNDNGVGVEEMEASGERKVEFAREQETKPKGIRVIGTKETKPKIEKAREKPAFSQGRKVIEATEISSNSQMEKMIEAKEQLTNVKGRKAIKAQINAVPTDIREMGNEESPKLRLKPAIERVLEKGNNPSIQLRKDLNPLSKWKQADNDRDNVETQEVVDLENRNQEDSVTQLKKDLKILGELVGDEDATNKLTKSLLNVSKEEILKAVENGDLLQDQPDL